MDYRPKMTSFPWQITPLNPPFGDPGFRLSHLYSGETLFFDLGDLHHLTARQILKASRIFISHAHIDHLVGFDQLLRLNLNRPRQLEFFGPSGITARLGHKLQGYTWNLTAHYELLVIVHEIGDHEIISSEFACRNKFLPGRRDSRPRTDPVIYREATFSVLSAALDHGITSLAFILQEPLQVNFRSEALQRLGLVPGPWLSRIRQALQSGSSPETPVPVMNRTLPLGQIAVDIALVRPGLKIAYLADFGLTSENLERIVPLISGADLLLCEAAFLEEEADKARATFHLTAGQAGRLAALAGVKRLQLFHFSPRHSNQAESFYTQARAHFSGPVT